MKIYCYKYQILFLSGVLDWVYLVTFHVRLINRRWLTHTATLLRHETGSQFDLPLETRARWWRVQCAHGWEVPINKPPLQTRSSNNDWSIDRKLSWQHVDIQLKDRFAFFHSLFVAVKQGLLAVITHPVCNGHELISSSSSSSSCPSQTQTNEPIKQLNQQPPCSAA